MIGVAALVRLMKVDPSYLSKFIAGRRNVSPRLMERIEMKNPQPVRAI